MTRTSRETLRQEAKDRGITLGDAKVLGEDPFFTGTDEEYRYAEWAAAAWDTMMEQRRSPIHLRGFHYWLQSMHYQWPAGKVFSDLPYAQTDPFEEWTWLLWAAKVARYLNIGEWKNLIDFKHPEPDDFDLYQVGSNLYQDGSIDVPELIQSRLSNLVEDILEDIKRKAPQYDDMGYQTYHLEVWVEKASMGEFIRPIVRRYQGCYQALVGQSSVEKVNMCYQRCLRAAMAGKKVRIFYISDWDRYGWQMPIAVARKLEFYARNNGGVDIKLKHIALNEEQVNHFNLPPAPKHGEMVVELDALEAIHPGALANIVRDALQPYRDTEKPRLVRQENERMAQQVATMVEQLRPQLEEALGGLQVEGLEELDLQEAIDPGWEMPQPNHEVDDDGEDWVLDTNIPYWDQWQAYRDHKELREERAV